MIDWLLLHLRLLLAGLQRNRVRTALALVSVGLGIGAIMVSLALRAGANAELDAMARLVGRNTLVVNAAQVAVLPGRGGGWAPSTRLLASDAQALLDRIPDLEQAVPVLERGVKARWQRQELNTMLRGVAPEYFPVRNHALARGRLLDDEDERVRARAAVLGAFVVQKLNAGHSLIGERIWIANLPFEVVGELEAKGASVGGVNQDDFVLVPLSTAQRRVANVDYLSSIVLRSRDHGEGDRLRTDVREVLRERHLLAAGQRDDFEIVLPLKADDVARVSGMFVNGFAQIFAAMSLSLGGIGLFGVTYLNIKDRVGEIGLRMAIGARRRDIAAMFIAEACVLSVAGGLLGLLCGAATILVLKGATGWHLAVEPAGLALPVLASMVIGLLSGVGPAWRASHMTVVEALRAR